MAIVVTPKNEVECNQVKSILHSHGRKLWATDKADATITVGKAVILWAKDKDYAVRTVDHWTVRMQGVQPTPVNALYKRLQGELIC